MSNEVIPLFLEHPKITFISQTIRDPNFRTIFHPVGSNLSMNSQETLMPIYYKLSQSNEQEKMKIYK